jgi:hypothetical protein
MTGKAPDDGLVVVEFASDPPPLSLGAAWVVLDMLLSARSRQAGKDQQAGPGELAERPDGIQQAAASALGCARFM